MRPPDDLTRRPARFNEAGAINPGKPPRLVKDAVDTHAASMRPGRLTPENLEGILNEFRDWHSFNEAGAINPGKPGHGANLLLIGPCFNEAGAINPGKPLLRSAQIAGGFQLQ